MGRFIGGILIGTVVLGGVAIVYTVRRAWIGFKSGRMSEISNPGSHDRGDCWRVRGRKLTEGKTGPWIEVGCYDTEPEAREASAAWNRERD